MVGARVHDDIIYNKNNIIVPSQWELVLNTHTATCRKSQKPANGVEMIRFEDEASPPPSPDEVMSVDSVYPQDTRNKPLVWLVFVYMTPSPIITKVSVQSKVVTV